MVKRERRRFSDEYKSETVGRLDEPGATYASVAVELGLTATQVKTWYLERAAAGSEEALARQKADAAELARLRRENKRLADENEILQKASAFFAARAGKT